MAMTIEGLIAGLQADIKAGYYTKDDVLVVDWFSFQDIQRVSDDMTCDVDVIMSESRAREIWEKAVERIDMEIDYYDSEQINHIILEEVEKNGEGNFS